MADERDSSATLVEAAPVATGAAKHQIVLGATKAAPALLNVQRGHHDEADMVPAASGAGRKAMNDESID
jgi:hypothetical protein